MVRREPPVIDLTPEGEFRQPASPFGPPPWAARIAAWALIVALVAGGIAVAAIAFWLALTLIPVAIIAGLVAYGAYRFQLWRAGR